MAESDSVPYSYDGLTESDIKKAKKELGESPNKVLAQIASLRHWVKGAQHLTCRTDDEFLLRFLRTAKFEQSRAQQLLDNFCTVRASEKKGCPDWFQPMPMDSPQLNHFLEQPINILLGHNDNGEAVLYMNFASNDYDKLPLTDFIRCTYMSMDRLVSSQATGIHGVRMISDMIGLTRKQMEPWSSPKLMFKLMRNMQDAFPLRIKAAIYFNEPAYLDVLLAICLPMMKEKLRKRIHRAGSDLQKLKKAVGPGADRLLPAELGGTNRTLKELIAARTSSFFDAPSLRESRLLCEIRVDEEKRQSDTMNFLKSEDELKDPGVGISGTFTKLNVD